VFEWLRRKGVRKVIQIAIKDDDPPPHTDETIMCALEGFEVEKWEWRKNDIPSDVISSCTSVLQDITLYSSGDESVVRHWLSDKGFGDVAKFPEVRSRSLPS
jgi:hypothetical protein